jgi:ABC-2 type transport system permease protein
MITSACTVYLRDLEHIIGVLMMAWIYLTPVMYDISYVTENAPSELVSIFYLNPMTSIAIAYRDILYYKQIPHMQNLMVAVAIGIGSLIIGSVVFAKLQKNFVEEL